MVIFFVLLGCVGGSAPTAQPRVESVSPGDYAYLDSQCEGPVRGPFVNERGGRYGVCCGKRVSKKCTKCCARSEGGGKKCKPGKCLKCKGRC